MAGFGRVFELLTRAREVGVYTGEEVARRRIVGRGGGGWFAGFRDGNADGYCAGGFALVGGGDECREGGEEDGEDCLHCIFWCESV